MSEEENKPDVTFWQKPVTRGVLNGIVFAGLLMAMQAQGIFQAPRPLTDASIAQHVFAGVVFGFIMYIIELWKLNRRTNAAKIAREVTEQQVEDERGTGDDAPRDDAPREGGPGDGAPGDGAPGDRDKRDV